MSRLKQYVNGLKETLLSDLKDQTDHSRNNIKRVYHAGSSKHENKRMRLMQKQRSQNNSLQHNARYQQKKKDHLLQKALF